MSKQTSCLRRSGVGAGFVPYSPLGRGFLTGTITPEKVAGSMLKGQARFDENFAANQRVVALVREIADELDATPAQVALAWLYAQGRTLGIPVVPIPGTRRARRLDENAAATHLALNSAHMDPPGSRGVLGGGRSQSDLQRARVDFLRPRVGAVER